MCKSGCVLQSCLCLLIDILLLTIYFRLAILRLRSSKEELPSLNTLFHFQYQW